MSVKLKIVMLHKLAGFWKVLHDGYTGMICKKRGMGAAPALPSFPFLLPSIPLIRNFLFKKKHAFTRVWINYIGNCNVNSDLNTSRRTIENISNKSFGLACWLNTKNVFWQYPRERWKKLERGIEKYYLENFVLV